eukprot:TRINITY_DN22276_c0_g1_i2.p1 TRINITY_DN22276_c0_g1~~TRINITY_DN22276_c0_g1_i2.p1  ORF type:complete len:281 (-),score=53.69 TRINITY_DN22276_c0_g1_i2:278-1120(-)
MTAAVDVSAPGIDTSKEDAEIAAVWKQLEDETRRLDDIKKRLSDPEALRSEKLMISPSLILQDMPEMPAVESADSSEEEDSGLPLAKQLSRKGSAALLSRSSSAHLIEVPPESMGREVDAWNCKGPPLPPIGYAGSTKQAELAGYPKRVEPAVPSGPAASIRLTPSELVFETCQAGSTYEQQVEIRNISRTAQRLRVLPCTNRLFTNSPVNYGPVRRPGNGPPMPPPTGLLAPGMTARLTVKFQPKAATEAEVRDQLVIGTESCNVALPVCALGVRSQRS